MRAVEEQSLSQKAMGEQICSLVEDYMGEEEGEERHRSLNTYNTRVLLKIEEQPTHHSKSSVFDEAYRGNMIKVTA
jgi:hypothetical protein